MQSSVVQELPSGTCVKLLLIIGSSVFSIVSWPAANIDMDKRFMRYPITDVAPGIWVVAGRLRRLDAGERLA